MSEKQNKNERKYSTPFVEDRSDDATILPVTIPSHGFR